MIVLRAGNRLKIEIVISRWPIAGKDMIRHWEEFQLAPDTKKVTEARISLTPKGLISLNWIAMECFKDVRAVVLLFDRINSLIGLRPSEPGVRNAFPLIKSGKSKSCFVLAKKFCNFYGIRNNATVVFQHVERDETGTVVLNLKSTVQYLRNSSGKTNTGSI